MYSGPLNVLPASTSANTTQEAMNEIKTPRMVTV